MILKENVVWSRNIGKICLPTGIPWSTIVQKKSGVVIGFGNTKSWLNEYEKLTGYKILWVRLNMRQACRLRLKVLQINQLRPIRTN